MTISKPTVGASGWNTAVDAVITAVNVLAAANVNVKDYGAKGDGTTNDAPAIAAAVAAVADTTGRIVFFPPGQYKLSSLQNSAPGSRSILYFTGLAGTTFLGAPGATLVAGVNNATVLEIKDSTDVTIAGLSVYGSATAVEDGANTRGIGIRLTGVTRGKVLRNTIANTAHNSIWLTGGCVDCLVDSNSAPGTTGSITGGLNLDCLGDSYPGFTLASSTYGNRFTNNYVNNGLLFGIAIDTNGVRTATIVSGNIIKNSVKYGILLHDCVGVQVSGNTIDRTDVAATQSAGAAIYHDCGLFAAGPQYDVAISDNHINSAQRGINVVTIEATTSLQALTINNNTITDVRYEAIRVYRNGGLNLYDVGIGGNIMRHVGYDTPGTYDAISIEGVSRGSVVGNLANGVVGASPGSFRYGLNVLTGCGNIVASNIFTGTSGATFNDSTGALIAHIDGNTGNVYGTTLLTPSFNVSLGDSNSGGHVRLQKKTSTPAAPGASRAYLYFLTGTNANTVKLCVRAGASGAETVILDNIPAP